MDVLFLEKELEPDPPPNTQTKEKMRKFRMQKAGRRISLFRTSGRPRQMRNSHWSPRPEARCHTPHPYRRTPSPTKQAAKYPRPSPPSSAQMTKKTARGDWSDESSTDSALKLLPIMKNQLSQARSSQPSCPLSLHLSMKRDSPT